MIISRTPLRISFVGGGTDLRAFYRKEPGAVISTAINKYMYVTVNKKFDDKIRLSYTRTEMVDNVNEIKHELVREAMKLTGVTSGVEITTMADIPAAGTGLGSSSSLTVGALNAFYTRQGKHKRSSFLAREACRIEIDIVREPIGKQDQHIVAYGGLNYIEFRPDEGVIVSPLSYHQETKDRLEKRLMLFYTGLTRKANTILNEQQARTEEKFETLKKMKEIALELKNCTNEEYLLDHFGDFLHRNWELKKGLVTSINNPQIDVYYQKALKAGAEGGKILGAGGGGFLLLYCKERRQNEVRQALKELRETPFSFEPQGSKIVYLEE